MQAFFKKIVSLLDAKFWKFLLVGVINTLVGMGIMYGLYNSFLYRFGAVGYWISSAANYVFASILSYFLNKHFTFQNKEKGAGVVLRFALNIAVCYAIAYGAAKPLARLIFRGLGETWQNNLAMLFGSGFFVLLNYLGQRLFAFREKKKSPGTQTPENPNKP